MITADGFDDAITGYTQVGDVVVYDYDKCVGILMLRDGMSYEDATEYMDFNVIHAHVGEDTPIFMYQANSKDIKDIDEIVDYYDGDDDSKNKDPEWFDGGKLA